MPLDLVTLLDDAVTALDLIKELLSGIGAELNMARGTGGHHDDLCSELVGGIGFIRPLDLIAHDRPDGIGASIGDHRLYIAVTDSALHRLLRQAQVDQQRTMTAQEDRPKAFDPRQGIVHRQPDHRTAFRISKQLF